MLRETRKAALSKLDEEKKSLEKSRLRLLNDLKRIDDRLTQIQAQHPRVANTLCLGLTLPTEVTCMIFDFSVATYSLEDTKTGKKSILPEVVISHVCKQWRDVSLNYPPLWTRFIFRAGNVNFMRNPIRQLKMYINRSGSLNLELFLDFLENRKRDPTAGRKFQEGQVILLDLAIKQVGRWKIVTLLPSIDLHFGALVYLKMASAPNLEYFVYLPAQSPNHFSAMPSRSIAPTMFTGGAPKLRSLMFDCSNLPVPPVSNITTLRVETWRFNMSTFTWEALLEILSIPSLANLSLAGKVFREPTVYSSSIINMNNLKHLRYTNQEYMTFLLPFLRAPLLETLSISRDQEIDEIETNPFGVPEEFYLFPSLQTLVLIDPLPLFLESAWDVMKMTKNINNLLILHSNDEDYFFSNLEDAGAFTDDCWPKLTSVTAKFHNWDHFDSFVYFFCSRPKDTLTLRLFEKTNRTMKKYFLDKYEEIQGNCIVEVLDAAEENMFMRSSWPPGIWCLDYPEIFIDYSEPSSSESDDDW